MDNVNKIKRKNSSSLVKREQRRTNTNEFNAESKYIDINSIQSKQNISAIIREAIQKEFHDELLERKVTLDSEICKKIRNFIIKYINDNKYTFDEVEDQKYFIDEFIINFSGYGVLQPLIDDETIEEIYVLGYDRIYINQYGERILTDVKFKDKEQLKTFIDNILSMINRRVDSLQPIEDAHLPDFNRVAVSGDVISPQGFTFNIRKFRKEKFTLDNLVENNTINNQMKDILVAMVNAKFNFIISGGTASGKTTLLNALAENIDNDEFVISIEDNLELQLGKEFWLQLETRKPNIEGKGEITMDDEFKHCLRRSPNRFIIGEIRDGKVANTFVTATNTGHDGCMATIHSNAPKMCINRIGKLISNETGQPIENCLSDFSEAINAIVQIKKLPIQKKRKVTDICYVLESGELFEWVKYDNLTDIWKINEDVPDELNDRLLSYGIDYKKIVKNREEEDKGND